MSEPIADLVAAIKKLKQYAYRPVVLTDDEVAALLAAQKAEESTSLTTPGWPSRSTAKPLTTTGMRQTTRRACGAARSTETSTPHARITKRNREPLFPVQMNP